MGIICYWNQEWNQLLSYLVLLLLPHSTAFCVHFVGLGGSYMQLKTHSNPTNSFFFSVSTRLSTLLPVLLFVCVCVCQKIVLCNCCHDAQLVDTHKVWMKFEMAKKRSGLDVPVYVYVVYLWLFSGSCFSKGNTWIFLFSIEL